MTPPLARPTVEDLERARLDQLAEKDRFLTHLSHELRTPLAVIYQFVLLIADGLAGPVTEEQADYLDVVVRNIDELKAMIDDLLHVGRIDRDAPVDCVAVRLEGLLAEVVQALQGTARERGIELTCRSGPLPVVSCDPERVRQIVTNLVRNSLRATPDWGRIEVTASVRDGVVHVAVRDTGRGIRAENLERVFEQFFQENDADSSRNGLGLFVCRELVTRQGGAIWAESEPGVATVVTFTLPTIRPES